MRGVLVGLIVLFVAAADAEPVVTFPGKITSVKAPNSNLRVTYFDPGENADKIHEYSLRLVRPDGRFDAIDVFTRSADVSWSASTDWLFVTDHIGSNVADCYVIKPALKGFRKISVTDVLTKKFQRFDRLMGVVDHGYVGCAKWISPDKIKVVAEGHGARDAKSKRWTDFKFAFAYDVNTGAATQISVKVAKSKL